MGEKAGFEAGTGNGQEASSEYGTEYGTEHGAGVKATNAHGAGKSLGLVNSMVKLGEEHGSPGRDKLGLGMSLGISWGCNGAEDELIFL